MSNVTNIGSKKSCKKRRARDSAFYATVARRQVDHGARLALFGIMLLTVFMVALLLLAKLVTQ